MALIKRMPAAIPWRRWVGPLALLFSVSLAGCDERELGMMEPQPLPASLTLVDLNGTEVPIKAFQGRVLILNFWATWCAPCREEMPELQRLHELLDPEQAQVAGVSVDRDVNLAREFLLETGARFEQFWDPDMVLAEEFFGIEGFPETLIVDPQGRLVMRIRGVHTWTAPAFLKLVESLVAAPAPG